MAGERVVVEGIQKVRTGMKVNPVAHDADQGKKKTAAAAPGPLGAAEPAAG